MYLNSFIEVKLIKEIKLCIDRRHISSAVAWTSGRHGDTVDQVTTHDSRHDRYHHALGGGLAWSSALGKTEK